MKLLSLISATCALISLAIKINRVCRRAKEKEYVAVLFVLVVKSTPS